MRHAIVLIPFALGALFGAAHCQAQVFRCPNGAGVSFQQSPCDGLDASGGRLIRSADGRTVSAADPGKPSKASTPAPAPAAIPTSPRVQGRTPLPGTDVLRVAKSP
jgi:hypothetical protein